MARIIRIYRGAGQFTEVDMDRDPILVEREKTHGQWKCNAAAAREIKTAIERWNTSGLPAHHIEALLMIGGKIARILQGDNDEKDHWIDIAGYAKLGAEACE